MKFLRKWEDAEPLERTLSITTFTISIIIIIIVFLHMFGILTFPQKYYIPLIILMLLFDGVKAWKRSKLISIFYFVITILFFMIFYLNWR